MLCPVVTRFIGLIKRIFEIIKPGSHRIRIITFYMLADK